MIWRRRGLTPYPGNSRIAKLAMISNQVIGGNKISLSLDQQFFAVMTVSVVAFMAGDVTDIHIVNPLLHGQFPEAGQRRHRGRGQSIQFVIREKPQEVNRIIRTDIF